MISVYRAGGVVSVYRYISARFHLFVSDALRQWAERHARMSRLITKDVTQQSGDG